MTDHTLPALDVRAAAQTLALAFHDDPVFRWWIADDARRRAVLPAFFAVVAGATEELHVDDDLDAVAVWTPPGAEDDEGLVPALVDATGEDAERMFPVLELMAQHHPAEPHWYLWFLGTRPERQSRGLGSALMRPVLERCDDAGLPAYLEATSDRGAALYARHGFETVGEIVLPGGPSLWPMWREAR